MGKRLIYEEPKLEVLQVKSKEDVITISLDINVDINEDEWTGFY